MANLVKNYQRHPYHLVDPSPWPLLASFGAFSATMGGVMYFHGYIGGGFSLSLGIFMIMFTMFVWWRDIIREATFEGWHTAMVQLGMRYGMILFIVSEVMFSSHSSGLSFTQVFVQLMKLDLFGLQKVSTY